SLLMLTSNEAHAFISETFRSLSLQLDFEVLISNEKDTFADRPGTGTNADNLEKRRCFSGVSQTTASR
ncbi:MAG: hypothetical protein QGG67_09750, partial [Gammaproteobacteria bacterium]|nr:hypothetical protein [Gammaproteobacteria bacterium]